MGKRDSTAFDGAVMHSAALHDTIAYLPFYIGRRLLYAEDPPTVQRIGVRGMPIDQNIAVVAPAGEEGARSVPSDHVDGLRMNAECGQ
jgi:hypothetical protein